MHHKVTYPPVSLERFSIWPAPMMSNMKHYNKFAPFSRLFSRGVEVWVEDTRPQDEARGFLGKKKLAMNLHSLARS
jgi:hypothetical protein